MKTLIWSLTALFAAGWTGLAWLLTAMDAGSLKTAGGTVADLPLPPLPDWLGMWIDTARLGALQTWSSEPLGWLGAVLPSGDALMAWVGPLLWVGWGLGLLLLLALAGLLHWAVGRGPAVRQALQSVHA